MFSALWQPVWHFNMGAGPENSSNPRAACGIKRAIRKTGTPNALNLKGLMGREIDMLFSENHFFRSAPMGGAVYIGSKSVNSKGLKKRSQS